MTMKILIKKQKDRSGAEAFTMGSLTAELDPKLIKALGFERPLRRMARHLVKQYPGSLGINVHGVNFNYILEPSPTVTR